MIRLDAFQIDEKPVLFEIRRDGERCLATSDFDDACRQLLAFGIDNPEQLVEAAVKWGAVEIHEDSNPRWRGG